MSRNLDYLLVDTETKVWKCGLKTNLSIPCLLPNSLLFSSLERLVFCSLPNTFLKHSTPSSCMDFTLKFHFLICPSPSCSLNNCILFYLVVPVEFSLSFCKLLKCLPPQVCLVLLMKSSGFSVFSIVPILCTQ